MCTSLTFYIQNGKYNSSKMKTPADEMVKSNQEQWHR